MFIQKLPSGKMWSVTVEPGELELTATTSWPHRSLVGFINERGTLRISRPVHAPRVWGQVAKIKLEDARRQLVHAGDLVLAKHVKAQKEEERTGRFVVRLSDGRSRRFHAARDYDAERGRVRGAHDWADQELSKMPPGSVAGFFHDKGVYADKPFSAVYVDEYGHLKQGGPADWEERVGRAALKATQGSPRRSAMRRQGGFSSIVRGVKQALGIGQPGRHGRAAKLGHRRSAHSPRQRIARIVAAEVVRYPAGDYATIAWVDTKGVRGTTAGFLRQYGGKANVHLEQLLARAKRELGPASPVGKGSPSRTSAEPITPVIFRVWKHIRETGGYDPGGDVIALFPTVPEHGGMVMSYQHNGPHGPASLSIIGSRTRAAKPAEYASLQRELERIGYRLKVYLRDTKQFRDERRRELRGG